MIKNLLHSQYQQRFKTVMFGILALMIALGEYTEAISLVNDAVAYIQRQYTNELEYELLEKLHVGNTVSYVESFVGSPQGARVIDQQTTANYFDMDKCLLTIFYKQQRVTGYTVLALVEGFAPDTFKVGASAGALGTFKLGDVAAINTDYVVDHSKAASYFVEQFDSGYSGLLTKGFLGNVGYGVNAQTDAIVGLYEQQVYGTDADIAPVLKALRNKVQANFYGEGDLTLAMVEKSLMTPAEFSAYFGGRP